MIHFRFFISILDSFLLVAIIFLCSCDQPKPQKQIIDFQINGKNYSLGKHFSEMNIPEKDIWLNTGEDGVDIPIADLRDSSGNQYGVYIAGVDSIAYRLHIGQKPLPAGDIEIKSGGEIFSYRQDSLDFPSTFRRKGYLFKIEMSETGSSFLVLVEEEIDPSQKQR